MLLLLLGNHWWQLNPSYFSYQSVSPIQSGLIINPGGRGVRRTITTQGGVGGGCSGKHYWLMELWIELLKFRSN